MAGRALGTDSWSILHIGLTNYLPITFGMASILISIILIGITWLLGTPPSLATLLNMIFVGVFFDMIHVWFAPLAEPLATMLVGQLALVIVGYVVLGFAEAWCISTNLGAGPRGQLVVTLLQRTGIRVATLRFGIEGIVALVGLLLGGPLGWATLIGVFFYGPITEKFIGVFRWFGRWGILSQFIHIPFNEKGKAAWRKSVEGQINA